jgi:hypothetical protein
MDCKLKIKERQKMKYRVTAKFRAMKSTNTCEEKDNPSKK